MSKDVKTKEPEAPVPDDGARMRMLAEEMAALHEREQAIREQMRALSAERQAVDRRVSALDHKKALLAASEELRKAGLIPGPGSRRRTRE